MKMTTAKARERESPLRLQWPMIALCKSCLKWGHEPPKTTDGHTVWGSGRGMEPDDGAA